MTNTFQRYPKESLEYIFENLIKPVWPELQEYENILHIIYAGCIVGYKLEHRSIDDLLDEVLEAVNQGKTKLLFICEAEDIQLEDIDVVHQVLDLLKSHTDKIKHKDCFYVFGAENIKQVYTEHCKKMNYKQQIHLLSVRHFERSFNSWIKKQKDFQSFSEYKVCHKEKKFLCFNKVPREHRIMLLDKIFEHDLLNKAYYSFQGEILLNTPDKTWLDVVNSKYTYVLQNKDKFPLVLNITTERTNPVDIIPDDYKYFDNSYFSVVTETCYFENSNIESSIFFSEKIWKAIVMQHPFILVGRYKMLSKLKEYGYKSFAPWIDESYDSILDPDKRMDAIIEEIKRLCAQTDEQYLQWQKAIAPIVSYNRKFFFENKTFTETKNISRLFEA